ncbi:hypothetical protein [Stakelama tenebrarum]|uniref:Uncharacterized protein n=1 Tax=Stakelama tenebrarum TaxID=2711215 RepID=A0A6G6Y3Q9_9SPHN|nr:hypothetical protein [Sphingosinithalassobacter tenebrarum]QIG79447.1 hypothetical protein G5C33_06370 [Sphingosinithalassobacter tenebrarum]
MDEYLRYGFYVEAIIPVVTDEDINDSDNLRDVRNYAASLDVGFRSWHAFITEFYRDIPAIFEKDGEEVFLNMDVFETPCIDYWFRDFCTHVPENVTPRLRKEARQRVLVLASLLKAHKVLERRK